MLLWYTPADQRSTFSFLFLLTIRLRGGNAFSEHRSSKSEQTEQNQAFTRIQGSELCEHNTREQSPGSFLKNKERKRMKQFDLEECLFVTIDLVQGLLDLLLAPIAVDIHFQHAGLGMNQPSNRRKKKERMFREQACTHFVLE
jgi:hypothetical protein